jgi:hypothetical protein
LVYGAFPFGVRFQRLSRAAADNPRQFPDNGFHSLYRGVQLLQSWSGLLRIRGIRHNCSIHFKNRPADLIDLLGILGGKEHISAARSPNFFELEKISVKAAFVLPATVVPPLIRLAESSMRGEAFLSASAARMARSRTPAFHVGNMGSNPLGDVTIKTTA